MFVAIGRTLDNGLSFIASLTTMGTDIKLENGTDGSISSATIGVLPNCGIPRLAELVPAMH